MMNNDDHPDDEEKGRFVTVVAWEVRVDTARDDERDTFRRSMHHDCLWMSS